MLVRGIITLAKNDQLTGHLFIRPFLWYCRQVDAILAPFPTFATSQDQAIAIAKRTSQFVMFILLPFAPVVVSGIIGVVIKLIAPLPPVRQDPNLVLSPDLIKMVIEEYLFYTDWRTVARVCTAWNKIVSARPERQILVTLSKMKAALSQMQGRDLDYLFAEIVKVEVLFDLAGAKATAAQFQSFDNQRKAFLAIIKIEAQRDLAGAKATVAQFQDSNNKDEVSITIAGLRELACGRAAVEIVKIERMRDLAAAKETASQIQDNDCKGLALVLIESAEAQQECSEIRARLNQMNPTSSRQQEVIVEDVKVVEQNLYEKAREQLVKINGKIIEQQLAHQEIQ